MRRNAASACGLAIASRRHRHPPIHLLPPSSVPLFMRDADCHVPLLRLLDGYPVRAEVTPDSGRRLVAAQDVPAGGLLLESRPYARTVSWPARKRWCAHCHGLSPGAPLKRQCANSCGAWFCSPECKAAGAASHPAARCEAAKALRAGCQPQLDAECVQLADLVLDVGAQHWRQRREPASHSAAAPGPPHPELRDVLAMYTPPAALLESRPTLYEWPAKWKAVAAAVTHAVACAEAGLGIQGHASLLWGLDETALAQAASKDLSNSFGLWDRCGSCAEAPHRNGGHGVFPAAALINHSCLPSASHVHTRQGGWPLLTVTALHDLHEGDEITIRYVDPTGGDAERSATFTDTWGFICSCLRCCGNDAGRTAAAAAWDGAFLCGCGYARIGAGSLGGKPRKRSECECPRPWVIAAAPSQPPEGGD